MASALAPGTRARSTERARGSGSDPVAQYLEEISRYDLLTPEGERELARAIVEGRTAEERLQQLDRVEAREGRAVDGSVDGVSPLERRRLRRRAEEGRSAAEAFVNANLRLVVSVAKRYQASGVPLLDLIQEGNLGLIRAVEKFDAEKGFRFSTYAVWWIRQFISRGIANSRSTVRLPSRAHDELLRVRDHSARLEQELGRPADPAELAEAADLSEERVIDLLRVSADPLSLSSAVGDEGGAELGDFVEDPEARAEVEGVTSQLLPEELAEVLSVLDERERQILILRHGFADGEPRSVADVADELGLSRERIRQLEQRGHAKLLHPSRRAAARLLLPV